MKTRYLTALLLTSILIGDAAQATTAPSLQERKEKIQAREKVTSPEALQRKSRSEQVLKVEGVPVNKFLPVIETEKEAKHRTKEEVAYRTMALLVVALKGEGLEQQDIEKLVRDYQLTGYFSPEESAFIKDISPSDADRVKFVWRYEAAWTLLWSLGYVDKLGKPTDICDVKQAVQTLLKRSPAQFVKDAKLRPLSEILDQADRIYRYDWAVVDARVNNKAAPAKLDADVTMERHYALNWLIGYMNQAWDDVSTDT